MFVASGHLMTTPDQAAERREAPEGLFVRHTGYSLHDLKGLGTRPQRAGIIYTQPKRMVPEELRLHRPAVHAVKMPPRAPRLKVGVMRGRRTSATRACICGEDASSYNTGSLPHRRRNPTPMRGRPDVQGEIRRATGSQYETATSASASPSACRARRRRQGQWAISTS